MSAPILGQRLQGLCLSALRHGVALAQLTIAAPRAVTILQHHIHTGQPLAAGYNPPDGPRKWLRFNQVVYEPQTEDEEPRPAVNLRLKWMFHS